MTRVQLEVSVAALWFAWAPTACAARSETPTQLSLFPSLLAHSVVHLQSGLRAKESEKDYGTFTMSDEAAQAAQQQAAQLSALLQLQKPSSAAIPSSPSDDHDAIMAAARVADHAFAAQSAPNARLPQSGSASAAGSHPMQQASTLDPWWNSANAGKRPHQDIALSANRSRSPAGPQAFVAKGKFSEGLDKLNSNVQASMQRAMAALNCDISTNISDSITDFASKVETRMAAVETQQERHETRLFENDVVVAGIQRQIAALETKQKAAAERIRDLQAAQASSAASVAQAT